MCVYLHRRAQLDTRGAMTAQQRSQTKKKAGTQDEKSDNSDDAIWDSRHKQRQARLAAAHRGRDVIQMNILLSVGELPPDAQPMPPDPGDRNISKRQWESQMQHWRSAVKKFIRSAVG